MTLLLTFEAIDEGKVKLTDDVLTSEHASSMGGSQVFLAQGEVQSLETMIKCIVVASGNDASVAVAEHVAGSEQAFVEMMNQNRGFSYVFSYIYVFSLLQTSSYALRWAFRNARAYESPAEYRGRPGMAQAGGKNPGGISDAIAEAAKVLIGKKDDNALSQLPFQLVSQIPQAVHIHTLHAGGEEFDSLYLFHLIHDVSQGILRRLCLQGLQLGSNRCYCRGGKSIGRTTVNDNL